MKTLEDFLEDQCGMVTPKLLERFEPHRAFVEKFISTYNSDPDLNIKDYTDTLWQFLPRPKNKHFRP